MHGDSRIEPLIEKLLDSSLTPEQVCEACPELLPQVRSLWERKQACDALLDAIFPPPEPRPTFVTPSPAPGPDGMPQIPGYNLEGVLGQGGMGVVYRARHLPLGRSVALKMLLHGAHASPESRERFLREAEAVAALRHPNIVQIHDMGEQRGQPYFTMEFVEGGTLAQKLAGTPLPPRQAAALLATLAEAVQAAHQSGVVHRDLKPANVLLTADGTPKISDFGLARRLDASTPSASLTWIGTAVGTPSYMAPEQAEAKTHATGPAVDIYALGAILYELLTGRPPFRAATGAETIRQAITQDPIPPSRLNGRVPRDLETICLKCLCKAPQHRYASAGALAADLHRFLGGEAIAARPDGRVARLFRRVRRRPALAAAILSSILLICGGLWLLSDRAAATRRLHAERHATEQAAGADLREMANWLKSTSWPEARAALERAKGRLGSHASAETGRTLAQGTRDLELAAHLEAIRMDVSRGIPLAASARPDQQYEQAFQTAGIGRVGEDPQLVATRIRASNISNAIMAALDDWHSCTSDANRRAWLLAVARKADPDPLGWRARARTAIIQADEPALVELARTAPTADPSVPLFLALDKQLDRNIRARLPFLKRVQQAHPGDFWLNQTLGEILIRENKPEEAIRYFQAAVSVRPRTALSHHHLSYALAAANRMEDALQHARLATEIEPTYLLSHQLLTFLLSELGLYQEASDRLRAAIRLNPNAALLYVALGHTLEAAGQRPQAIAQLQHAIELDPANADSARGLYAMLSRDGQSEAAQIAWQNSLQSASLRPADQSAYAIFCAFIDNAPEYHRARQQLLPTLSAGTDPFVTAIATTACLLLPNEPGQTAALAERAAAWELTNDPGVFPSRPFVRGLAEYRREKFDDSIATLRQNAPRAVGPATFLVLAMALHQSGREAEARSTLATAVMAQDWRAIRARDQGDWIAQVLRREAERMIVPALPAFLAGEFEPRDRDERRAMIGACLFADQNHALARLYSGIFAEGPQAANDLGPLHRYTAVRTAALTGCGQGGDGKDLGDDERKRWRTQAHDWLAQELRDWSRKLDEGSATEHQLAWRALTYIRADPELDCVRQQAALDRYSAEECDRWLALWKQTATLLNRATSL